MHLSHTHTAHRTAPPVTRRVGSEDLHVIRPLAYARESMMRDYALSSSLPVVNENCPACFEEPKERARIKKLLSKEEKLCPAMFDNLRKAMAPLMDKGVGDMCREFGEVVVDRGRRGHEILKGGRGKVKDAGGGG